MPYHVVSDHAECSADKPHAVVKESDGTVMGCHASEDDAHAQMAALYANEADRTVADAVLDFAPTVSQRRRIEMERFWSARARGDRLECRMLAAHPVRVVGKTNNGPVLRFVLFTEGVKRDGDTVVVKGADLTEFKRNPRMLWAHDRYNDPVGNWIPDTIRKASDPKLGRIIEADARPLSLDDGSDTARRSRQLFRMYELHDLDAVSGSWLSSDVEMIRSVDGMVTGFRHLKWEVIEGSMVPIGADPAAQQRLMTSLKSGTIDQRDRAFFERALAGDAGPYVVRDLPADRELPSEGLVAEAKGTPQGAGDSNGAARPQEGDDARQVQEAEVSAAAQQVAEAVAKLGDPQDALARVAAAEASGKLSFHVNGTLEEIEPQDGLRTVTLTTADVPDPVHYKLRSIVAPLVEETILGEVQPETLARVARELSCVAPDPDTVPTIIAAEIARARAIYDAALRAWGDDATDGARVGAVLAGRNRKRLEQARDHVDAVLKDGQPSDDEASLASQSERSAEADRREEENAALRAEVERLQEAVERLAEQQRARDLLAELRQPDPAHRLRRLADRCANPTR